MFVKTGLGTAGCVAGLAGGGLALSLPARGSGTGDTELAELPLPDRDGSGE